METARRLISDRGPAEKRWVFLAYLLIVLTMLCGAGSVVLYLLREAEAKTDARYAACIGFNQEQRGDRNAQLNGILVVIGVAEPGDLTAEDRARIAARLPAKQRERFEAYEQQAALDNPFRDCTDAGIEDYYKHPPRDPATTD